MSLTEYKPGTTFAGRMGRTVGESDPAWPAPVRSTPGAPNVVYIVLDDTGYGQFGCYGSPIKTPNLDRLAQNGLLYSNMHTTALCSPSRSCMLTGRNHHSNAMSCITEGSEGYPGDSLGIEAPAAIRGVAQSPIEGVSLAHTFNDADAPTKHHTQYFEMFAHRSLYHDGWRAVCPFPGTSFAEAGVSFGQLELTSDQLRELDATGWELYHVEVDPAETNNLAEQERPRLIEMIALWYTEAGKYQVFPLDSRGSLRFADERPQIAEDRDTYVYYPGTQLVPENVAAKILNRGHRISADVELTTGDEGVVVCHGSNIGGYTLFVQDGKLHYVQNYVGAKELHVASESPVPDGKHNLRFEFEPTGPADLRAGKGTPGPARLFVDGEQVGAAEFDVTVPIALGIGSGVCVGRNPGSPVSQMYPTPFAFTGSIDTVTISLAGDTLHDQDEAKQGQARIAMARQ